MTSDSLNATLPAVYPRLRFVAVPRNNHEKKSWMLLQFMPFLYPEKINVIASESRVDVRGDRGDNARVISGGVGGGASDRNGSIEAVQTASIQAKRKSCQIQE
jgi:hypothetical protein